MTAAEKPDSDTILLVDDESRILLSFSVLLKSAGMRGVVTLTDSREVLPFLKKHPAALLVLDLVMPHVPGTELLPQLRDQFPGIPVIVMTATNDIDTAVECMKNGAVDFLVKPVENNRFVSSVQRALEIRRLKQEVSSLKASLLSDKLNHPEAFSHIVTRSKHMLGIFKYIEAVSPSPHPVIVSGETGVGKELTARSIHLCSGLEGEFVAVNVAGLDDTMFSDTLFGHRKGAFTDAHSQRDGLISRAAGGTIFLDEIGDLNEQSQVRLLRLIQESEYYRLGEDIPLKSDARIIVATNRDLNAAMQAGKFRKDLYYRLCSHHIELPPLRERREDIHPLLSHFLRKSAARQEKKAPTPPPELLTLLSAYEFPGNIRQLESMVYDAVSRHKSGVLSMESFKGMIHMNGAVASPAPLVTLGNGKFQSFETLFGKFPNLKEMEMLLIDEALKRSEDNQGIAASMLGITRQALNKRLNRRK